MTIHKVSKYFQVYLTIVSLAAGLFVAGLSFMAAHPNIAYAATPFGGLVTLVVPPIPSPVGPPICPLHMVVTNFANSGVPVGVYVGPATTTYLNYTLHLPGKYLLGNHSMIPYPTCPFPYPVYMLQQVGTS